MTERERFESWARQRWTHPEDFDQRIKEYRELTAEQTQLFDQCLIVKPGSPALEIVLPKKRAAAGAQNAGDHNM